MDDTTPRDDAALDFLLTRRDEDLVLFHLGEIRRYIARQQLQNTEDAQVARPLLVPVNLAWMRK